MPTVSAPKDELPPLAANVARFRAERGWTLQEAGAASGVSFQLISMIEKGTRPNPTLDSLLGLSQAYGVSIEDLIAPDVPTPAPLQELIESGLIGDVTTDELRQLRLAKGLLGREPDREDYFALVQVIRAKRSSTR